jgi:hypothetical protein
MRTASDLTWESRAQIPVYLSASSDDEDELPIALPASSLSTALEINDAALSATPPLLWPSIAIAGWEDVDEAL